MGARWRAAQPVHGLLCLSFPGCFAFHQHRCLGKKTMLEFPAQVQSKVDAVAKDGFDYSGIQEPESQQQQQQQHWWPGAMQVRPAAAEVSQFYIAATWHTSHDTDLHWLGAQRTVGLHQQTWLCVVLFFFPSPFCKPAKLYNGGYLILSQLSLPAQWLRSWAHRIRQAGLHHWLSDLKLASMNAVSCNREKKTWPKGNLWKALTMLYHYQGTDAELELWLMGFHSQHRNVPHMAAVTLCGSLPSITTNMICLKTNDFIQEFPKSPH